MARGRSRHRAAGWPSGLVRSAAGRLLAAALVLALSGLVVGGAGTAAQAVGDDPFVVTLADGSPSTGPAAGPTPLEESDGAYRLPAARAGDAVTFSLNAACSLEDGTGTCAGATVVLRLGELELAELLTTPPAHVGGVGYTVQYLDGADVVIADPAAGLAQIRAARLSFVSYDGAGAPVPLSSGSIVTIDLLARVVEPSGGGTQTGTLTVEPALGADALTTTTIDVATAFVPRLSTATDKQWDPADPYLSGAADTARTAEIVFTNTGQTATSLVVDEPADPTAVPAGAEAFNLLAVTGLELTAWPAGATSAAVQTWHDGVAGPGTTVADQAALQTWFDALAPTDLAALTGVRLSFAGTFAQGASGTLRIATEQLEEGAVTAGSVTGRHGAVAYEETGAVPTPSVSSDFHTVGVTNAATTTASSSVDGSTPATSTASAGFRIWDPDPYAGSTKRFVQPGTSTDVTQLYPGGFAVAQLVGTSWTRRDVDALVLADQPDATGDAPLGSAVAAFRSGGLDRRMFASSGLVLAGFGAAVSGGAGDGTGLVWPTGADTLVLALQAGSAGSATWTGAPGDLLPTAITDFAGFTGSPAWSDVTGLTARFTGAIEMGATGTVPYVVTTGADAVAGTTVDNVVLARTTVGGLVSDPTPRTAASGNKPLSRDSLSVAEPYATVALTKTIPEPYVNTDGGTVTAVLRATAAAGTDLPTTLVLTDAATTGSSGGWWARFAPTGVTVSAAADVTTVVEYSTGSGASVQWHPAPAGPWAASTTAAWTGVRVAATKNGGGRFALGEVVQAVVRFAVATDAGTTFLSGASVSNCAQAVAELAYGGPTPSTRTSTVACDSVVGYDLTGTGGSPAALVKHLDTDLVEGSGAQATATLTWGTGGRGDLTSVTVGDVSTGTDGSVLEGRAASFWDTFDLVGLPAVTSGAVAAADAAYDPYLVFDQVADVQVYDTEQDVWVSLADQEWDGATWQPAGGPRSDVTFGGADRASFPYGAPLAPGNLTGTLTVFPGMAVVDDALRERVGGVRVVVEPRDASDRSTIAAGLASHGDWRVPALSGTLTGADGVAITDGLVREVDVTVRLRGTSRANPALVVNDAATYDVVVGGAAQPSLLVDDGVVQGFAGGTDPVLDQTAANHPDLRTVTLTPTTLHARATKSWVRATRNPVDITGDTEHWHSVPLAEEDGDPAAAVLTVTGRNTSDVPVDTLTLTEPAGIDALVGEPLDADAPFAWFALDQVTELTSAAQLPGATSLVLTAYVLAGDEVDRVTLSSTDAGAPGIADDLAAALADQGLTLARVVGLRLEYSGRIAADAQVGLTARTVLRDANLVTGDAPADVVGSDDPQRLDNSVHVSVTDRLQCVGETYGADGSCTPLPAQDSAADHVTVQVPEVQAFASKLFSAGTVRRDQGTSLTARLEIQSFGNTEPDALTLTDADPTSFDAVGLTGVSLVSLPTGASTARLDVLLPSDAVRVGSDGAYTGTAVAGDGTVADSAWTTVGSLTAGGAWAPPAAGWSEVIGVRVVFAAPVGSRIATPGTTLGAVDLTGVLRDELLAGGLPTVTDADAAWGEASRNPGESTPGLVENTVLATASRGAVTSAPEQATAAFSVQAGTERLRVTKTSAAAPAGGWSPGSTVPFTITVRNDGTADVLGLVITDRLPADDTLGWGGQSTVTSDDAGLGLNDPVTADEAEGTVVIAWPATARLSPGRSVTVVLPLTIAEAPSTLTIVNTAEASASGRAVVAAPRGNGGQPVCSAGTYRAGADGATGACVASATALTMNVSNVFLSEKWVSTGTTSATSTVPGSTCTPRGSGADATWFRFPCVVDAQAGDAMSWQVQVHSLADAPTPTVTVVDMLPRPDDYQAMKTSGRGSRWRPVWDGVLPVVVPVTGVAGAVSRTDGVARYYVTRADYTTTTAVASTSYDPLPPEAWTEVTGPVPAVDAAEVTGLKVVLDYSGSGGFTKYSAVRLQWRTRAPLAADAGAVAWNSFAFRVEPENRAPLASVPLKAGVRYVVPSTLVAVGDVVWHDADGDGVQDAGEEPVAGVTVALLAADGTVLGTTTTDQDGAYLFDGLPAGTYAVRFELDDPVLAARYRWTRARAGNDVTTDSDPSPVSGSPTVAQGAPFTLDEGSATVVEVTDGSLTARYVDRTRDAGLVDAPLALGDRVWLDADHDGVQGPGEPGLAGVVVRVLSADGETVLATTTTDADGWYAVGGLAAGDYMVEFGLPSGYRFSRPLQGGDATTDSDASRSTGRTQVVHLDHAGTRMRPTTEAERAALAAAGTDAGMIDPTIDAGVFALAVAGPVTDVTVRKEVVQPVDADGGPVPVQGGDVLTYSLVAATTGTVAAEDVELTDVVPSELAVTAVTTADGDPAWTCDLSGQDTRGYGGTVHCVLADDLLPGTTAPAVLVTATVDPAVAVDTITNTATVGATNEDPELVPDDSDSATVPVKWLAVTATPTCVADAPWLDYVVEAHQVDTATLPVTIRWYADADGDGVADGPAIATRTLPAGAALSGSVLWPGAAVDSEGRGSAWPGWRVVRAGETPQWENLVLDPSLPEYALRAGALVEVSINPTRSVTVAYPDASATCETGGTPALLLSKTADVDEVQPGAPVDYTLAVRSTGVGATNDAVLTDVLPRELRATAVTVAPRTSPDDPTWTSCTITGQDAQGYGGTVTCVLDGWVGHGQVLPVVVIETTVSPEAAGVTRNVASVRWGDPETGERTERGSDSGVDVQVRSAVLAADPGTAVPVVGGLLARTGLSAGQLGGLAVLLVLTGAGAAGAGVRRRRA